MKKISDPILLTHSLMQTTLLALSICLALFVKDYSFLLCGFVPLACIIIQLLVYGTGFGDDNS